MGEEKNWHVAVITVLMFVIGGLFVFSITNTGVDDIPTISVTGTAKTTVDPDEVAVYLVIETLDWDASVSQELNAEIFENVKAQLLLNGVDEENIKTTYYTIYEEEEWVCPDYYYLEEGEEVAYYDYYSDCGYEVVGYKTYHTIEVISEDVGDVGELLDDVVKAGATVNYVYFQLSDETREELETQLISKAVGNAELKAGEIATASGMSLGKLSSANYGNMYYYPIYESYDTMSAAMSSDSGTSTSIEPGQIDLSISVSMVFEAN